MVRNLHGKKEAIDGKHHVSDPEIAAVQIGSHEKIMNVCQKVLETTNDIVRTGAELTGLAAGAIVNATIGFTGGLLRGATGRHADTKTQKRSNAA